jgi:hypothetical protein
MVDDLSGFATPVVSRYAATTAMLLRWFNTYNRGRAYREQVKPFNFLLSFQAKPSTHMCAFKDEAIESGHDNFRTRRGQQKVRSSHPVAPYDKDSRKAVPLCFDRETGEAIAEQQLLTYREALLRYHLHPEAKFDQGEYTDSGLTYRKHVLAETIEHIGKEANQWEQQFYIGVDEEAQVIYGIPPEEIKAQWDEVFRDSRRFKLRQIARASAVHVSEVSRLLQGLRRKPTIATMQKLQIGLRKLKQEQEEQELHIQNMIVTVKRQCQSMSIRLFAALVGVDQGSLTRILAGQKKPSKGFLEKMSML